MRFLFAVLLLLALSSLALAQAGPPYVYSFPKAPSEWGEAVAFGNLSPGFFQVMFRDLQGVVRIATYGIVGGSMDKLTDPQLMMVFAFDQKAGAAQKGFEKESLARNLE